MFNFPNFGAVIFVYLRNFFTRLSVPFIQHSFWLFLFLSFLFYPGKLSPFGVAGFYLTILFCYLFSFLSWAMEKSGIMEKLLRSLPSYSETKDHSWILKFFFVMAVIGIGLHFYDKSVLRGYHYFSCDEFREMWLKDGMLRGVSISSWQSAMGHFLTYFAYIPCIFITTEKKWEKCIFAISLFIITAYSWSMLSRSTMLSFVFMAVFSILLGLKKERQREVSFKVFFLLFTLIGFFTLTFTRKAICVSDRIKSYSFFTEQSLSNHNLLLSSSGSNSGYNLETLNYKSKILGMSGFLESSVIKVKLNLEVSPLAFTQNSKLGYVANMIPLYMLTGINSFTEILSQEIQYDWKYFFGGPIEGLQKLGVVSKSLSIQSVKDYLKQGFLNFPGVIYFSFGPHYFWLTPLILAILWVFLKTCLKRKNYRFFLPFMGIFSAQICLMPLANLSTLMCAPFLFAVAAIYLMMCLYFPRNYIAL
jgi:hypothetical protein